MPRLPPVQQQPDSGFLFLAMAARCGMHLAINEPIQGVRLRERLAVKLERG
jgi:hypothetical protein